MSHRFAALALAACFVACARPAGYRVEEPRKQPNERGSAIEELVLSSDGPRLETFGSKDALVAFLKEQKLVGSNDMTAKGNMWGDSVGDAFGASGLGLSGTGEGGGGKGEGVGLGAIGTIGQGSGTTASITNRQHAGVDEGGIVKTHGEHFVILRRGRLFTVRMDNLAAVDSIDAFGPGIDPSGTWYDEMLVSKDTVVVIGYSYSRGGTEIGLFDIDTMGTMRARATYQLRSNDYYSSRNYASRLIGTKLVFYSPISVHGSERDPLSWAPALRKWKQHGSNDDTFFPIIDFTTVYRPLVPFNYRAAATLHTVTTCDLSQREMTCNARGVIGEAGRVFYVSPTSVYVWTTQNGILYRLPLEGGAPGVIAASGAPLDNFSFRENDATLDVLVRAESSGDGMWRAETTAGDVALLHLPLKSFSKTLVAAPSASYTALPRPNGDTLQNRFVGDYVLYGAGTSWGAPGKARDGRVFAHRVGTDATATLPLGHNVDRIEALGKDAIVVGADDNDLYFSPIALASSAGGKAPSIATGHVRHGAAQGELRSHGFFYRSDGNARGVLGLPVRRGGGQGWEHILTDSASIAFLTNDGLTLRDAGMLSAKSGGVNPDGCRASCVDWYGNARPIFVGSRVLALLGYEMVEGSLAPNSSNKLSEVRRSTFAPKRH